MSLHPSIRALRHSFVLTALTAFAVTATSAHAGGAPAAGGNRAAAVDAVFADFKAGEPGLAVGIYQSGTQVLSRGYGTADIEHGVPITPETVFNLASVSKQFTAFSIALLAREGKVDLQADIRTYLPGMPDVGQKVMVYDLVHHISGVRDYVSLAALSGHDDESLVRQEYAVNLLEAQRSLNHPPGTQYEYSNSGYMLLAEVAEAAAGKSLREFAHERIFQPLGMKSTRIRDSLNRIEPGYAVGYEPNELGGSGKWERAVYNRIAVGPGNVISTVGDLVKWIRNFAHPVVGDRALIEQLSAPATLRNGESVNYGYGLKRDSVIGHDVVMHTGSISGFRSILIFFPKDDFGLVILANRKIDLKPFAAKVAGIYLQPAADKPGEAKAKEESEHDQPKAPAPSVSSAELAALAGTYHSDEIDTSYRASVEGGKLTLRSLYLTKPQSLSPSAKDRFTGDEDGPLSGLEVAIRRDATGKVSGLLFDYGSLHDLELRKLGQ